jgi:hypothetical protein
MERTPPRLSTNLFYNNLGNGTVGTVSFILITYLFRPSESDYNVPISYK